MINFPPPVCHTKLQHHLLTPFSCQWMSQRYKDLHLVKQDWLTESSDSTTTVLMPIPSPSPSSSHLVLRVSKVMRNSICIKPWSFQLFIYWRITHFVTNWLKFWIMKFWCPSLEIEEISFIYMYSSSRFGVLLRNLWSYFVKHTFCRNFQIGPNALPYLDFLCWIFVIFEPKS